MKILSRYVLAAHVGPFLFGFCVVTFILVMDFVFIIADMVIGKGLDLWTVLEVFALNLAWMIALSVPMAVLIATLMAFGRLSADNEITAIRASGISLYRITLPVLVASVVVAGGMMGFNDQVLPEANHRARKLMSAIHRKRPALTFKEGIFMDDLPGYSILLEHVGRKTNRIKGITIYETVRRKTPRIVIAREGEIHYSDDGDVLILDLVQGEIHEVDPDDDRRYLRQSFSRYTLRIAGVGNKLVRINQSARGDREMSSAMMWARIKQLRKDQERIQEESKQIFTDWWYKHPLRVTPQASVLSNQAPSGTATVMPDAAARVAALVDSALASSRKTGPQALLRYHQVLQQKIRRQVQLEQSKQRQINTYLVEIHKKFAIPIACIVFVLSGAPLGIVIRKSGALIGMGCSLGFFLLYWAFLIAGEELADRSLISPFLAMWGANLIIGSAGLYLFVRVAREGSLLFDNRLAHWLMARRIRATASTQTPAQTGDKGIE